MYEVVRIKTKRDNYAGILNTETDEVAPFYWSTEEIEQGAIDTLNDLVYDLEAGHSVWKDLDTMPRKQYTEAAFEYNSY